MPLCTKRHCNRTYLQAKEGIYGWPPLAQPGTFMHDERLAGRDNWNYVVVSEVVCDGAAAGGGGGTRSTGGGNTLDGSSGRGGGRLAFNVSYCPFNHWGHWLNPNNQGASVRRFRELLRDEAAAGAVVVLNVGLHGFKPAVNEPLFLEV